MAAAIAALIVTALARIRLDATRTMAAAIARLARLLATALRAASGAHGAWSDHQASNDEGDAGNGSRDSTLAAGVHGLSITRSSTWPWYVGLTHRDIGRVHYSKIRLDFVKDPTQGAHSSRVLTRSMDPAPGTVTIRALRVVVS
jgi:hypothetical protein